MDTFLLVHESGEPTSLRCPFVGCPVEGCPVDEDVDVNVDVNVDGDGDGEPVRSPTAENTGTPWVGL